MWYGEGRMCALLDFHGLKKGDREEDEKGCGYPLLIWLYASESIEAINLLRRLIEL